MKKLTILMAAIALVCFSVPAMAADWNFYGSARMATFYVSDDFQDDESEYTAAGDDKDAEVQWALQGNSRIGSRVKADHVAGRVELALKGNSGGDLDVGTRLIYGTWNFGAGKFKVGKDYTPVSQFISGQVADGDLGLLGVGTVYGNRVGQLALSFGGFEIALMEADSRNVAQTIVVGGFTFDFEEGDVDKLIPKIEAKWGMSFDAFNFNIQGGYNYFSVEDVVSSVDGKKNDIDVTSYTIGADAGFNFGPAYVKGAISYGQNIGTAGWSLPGNRNQGAYAEWDGDDDTDDVDTLMGALVAGLKVSDMLAFEGGFGMRQDDPDEGKKSKPWSAYVQSVITLAPGVYVVPEISYFDGDQNYDGDDTTNTLFVGAKWQIDF